jgi:hypothetical protein
MAENIIPDFIATPTSGQSPLTVSFRDNSAYSCPILFETLRIERQFTDECIYVSDYYPRQIDLNQPQPETATFFVIGDCWFDGELTIATHCPGDHFDTRRTLNKDNYIHVTGSPEIFEEGTIAPESFIEKEIDVALGDTLLEVTLLYPGSELDLSLVTPSGNTLHGPGPSVAEYINNDNAIFYAIQNPDPGMWTARIDPIDVPNEGEPFIFTATAKKDQSTTPVAEFPSIFMPATMIIGMLGAVLLIQKTRES